MTEPEKIKYVLLPTNIAEQCYLSEALQWIVSKQFPLVLMMQDGVEYRLNKKFFFGIEPNVYDFGGISPFESRLYGLPKHPKDNEKYKDVYFRETGELEELIAKSDTKEEKYKYIEQIRLYEQYLKEFAAWDLQYERIIEPYKARLYLSLRQGDIIAKGMFLPGVTVGKNRKSFGLIDVEWKPIPKDFWVFDKIDWVASIVNGDNCAYARIIIDTNQLFDLYKFQNEAPGLRVAKVNNGYILLDDEGDAIIPPLSTRGRPSLPWEEFHVEMARRLQAGELPDKQEAAIADMQEWCRQRWHRDVSRGALFPKIKQYYDAFFRKSENE